MSVLSTRNITKDYPGCRALDQVSVQFAPGRVHALIGKNGSGKSTLVKIFSGVTAPTSGEVRLGDDILDFQSPEQALQTGIATVYQELSLIPYLSVAENILLGRLPKKGGVIDWKAAYSRARELLKKMNADIDPAEKVYKLSMWQCQVVEITKAMSYNPKVLMLDEPTSALAQNEVQSLFEVIRNLRKQNVIIIYISHRLQELWEIADTVTVLRDGKLIGSVEMKDIDHKGIVQMMFGDVEIRKRPADLAIGEKVVLSVKNLTKKDKYQDISFDLHEGEIVGIAGMLGAGRTELLRGIFGADSIDSGTIVVEGKQVPRNLSPEIMKKYGLGLTPEERKSQGVILMHSIQDNLCYACLDRICTYHVINKTRHGLFARRQINDLDIKVASPNSLVSSLSGGNQQKVVVGNWLNNSPKVMLYDEPSRGIDVVAKQQIFQIMWDQSRKGVSSIFVSSELEELLEVCHRIIVMYMGRFVGEINPDQIKIDELYAAAMGGEIK